MEEAEELGDRFGFMHQGKLYCYGSLEFIQQTFGSGYLLTIIDTTKNNFEKINIDSVVCPIIRNTIK